MEAGQENLTSARDHKAANVMPRDGICVDGVEEIGLAAWRMVQHGFQRIPVIQDVVPAGIITRANLVRLLAESPKTVGKVD